LQKKKVQDLPVKLKKVKISYRFFNYIVFEDDKLNTVIQKRDQKGIWQNLYEFPLIETDSELNLDSVSELISDKDSTQDKIKGIQIPKIKIDLKRKQDANILEVIKNYDKIISDYLETNSFNREIDGVKTKFLRYTPDNFFTEIDLFTDENMFHKLGEDQNWNFEKLIISEKDMKEILSKYGEVKENFIEHSTYNRMKGIAEYKKSADKEVSKIKECLYLLRRTV
jgi:hypothetical protein